MKSASGPQSNVTIKLFIDVGTFAKVSSNPGASLRVVVNMMPKTKIANPRSNKILKSRRVAQSGCQYDAKDEDRKSKEQQDRKH